MYGAAESSVAAPCETAGAGDAPSARTASAMRQRGHRTRAMGAPGCDGRGTVICSNPAKHPNVSDDLTRQERIVGPPGELGSRVMAQSEADASKRIDERIQELGDWRGTMLGTVRSIIREA